MSLTSLVTGASGGIGREVAKGLAAAGHHVILVGRDPARTEAAARAIRAAHPAASLETRRADLSLLQQTRSLGNAVLADHPALHRLILNAGTFQARRRETAEGHERVLATNHLCPFLLTQTLLPALRAAAPDARVIAVGSDTSDRARIDPDDLELRSRWGFRRAYARSKLALMMATFEWADRLRPDGVACVVVHPGAVATGLVRTPGPIGWAWRAMRPFLRTEAEGAATILRTALAPCVQNGAYFKSAGEAQPNTRALEGDLRQRVWQGTAALLEARANRTLPGSDGELKTRAAKKHWFGAPYS